MPIDVKFKSFATNSDKGLVVTINNLIDIFPNKLKNKTVKTDIKPKTKVKFVPDTAIFDVITVDRLYVNIDNFEPIYGYLLVFINQIINILRIKDCIGDYEITNTNTPDKKPNFQIYVHFKIHLIMIFSVIFKIIKIRRKNKDEN